MWSYFPFLSSAVIKETLIIFHEAKQRPPTIDRQGAFPETLSGGDAVRLDDARLRYCLLTISLAKKDINCF